MGACASVTPYRDCVQCRTPWTGRPPEASRRFQSTAARVRWWVFTLQQNRHQKVEHGTREGAVEEWQRGHECGNGRRRGAIDGRWAAWTRASTGSESRGAGGRGYNSRASPGGR